MSRQDMTSIADNITSNRGAMSVCLYVCLCVCVGVSARDREEGRREGAPVDGVQPRILMSFCEWPPGERATPLLFVAPPPADLSAR